MKYCVITLLLCLMCIANAQHIAKKCKTCGKVLSECQFNGQHPSDADLAQPRRNFSSQKGKKNNAELLKKARQYFDEGDYVQAKKILNDITNYNAEYFLLRADLIYRTELENTVWRGIYKNAARRFGSAEAKEKVNSLIAGGRFKRIYSDNPQTEAEMIASEVKSVDIWHDDAEILKNWFSKSLQSAELGYKAAQINVAMAYLYGIGTDTDFEQSFLWFSKNEDDSTARDRLAWFYSNGICVEKDEKIAFDFLSRNKFKSLNLGLCYEFGKGIDVDLNKALSIYRDIMISEFDDYSIALERYCYLRCIQGVPDSCELSGDQYLKLYNYTAPRKYDLTIPSNERPLYELESKKFLEKAFVLGVDDINTIFSMGKNLEFYKEYDKAFICYAKAAECNLPSACVRVANCYEKGLGVGRNLSAAKEWYQKAYDLGEKTVEKDIIQLSKKGY